MKNAAFFVCFSFLQLIRSVDCDAQVLTREKGLTTVVFTLQPGTIKVYLPDDIRQGDVISGTVVANPEGGNERQRQRNKEELAALRILFSGQAISLDKQGASTSFTSIPQAISGCTLGLLPASGSNPLQQLQIPPPPVTAQKPRPLQCSIPGHVLAGSPVTIPGPFDGNAASTQCSIGSQPATVLAESPRSSTVVFPGNANGMQQTQITENGQPPCVKNVSAVQMDVSAGKLSLRRGEQTFIKVDITGLQDLADTAFLSLQNLAMGVVNLLPSNTILIPFLPGSANSFSRSFDVQSIKTGDFSVNVNLDLPQPGIMLSPDLDKYGYNIPDGAVTVEGPECNCVVKASVSLFKQEDDVITYMAMPVAGCNGPRCAYANTVSFTWQIVAGGDQAEIIETSANGYTIKVRVKGEGHFSIRNTAKVTCSDGTTCSDAVLINESGDEIEGAAGDDKLHDPLIVYEPGDPKNPITWDSTPPKGKACLPDLKHEGSPAMTGGLVKYSIGAKNEKLISRDEFIVLQAAGADTDMAIITCYKVPECLETGCEKKIPIAGKVRFEWKVIEDPAGNAGTRGSFVQIGCLPALANAAGEQVIFKPPYVPLPDTKGLKKEKLPAETTLVSTVVLTIIDAGSPVTDTPVEKIIQIAVTRSTAHPDFYSIAIKGVEKLPGEAPAKPSATPPGCSCIPFGPKWIPGDNLVTPEIIAPAASVNNSQLMQGQWVILHSQDQKDLDNAGYGCNTDCPTSTLNKNYHDIIYWKWEVEGGGRIVLSDSTQYIVYEAPLVFPDKTDYLDITFTVSVFNLGERADPRKGFTMEGEKVIVKGKEKLVQKVLLTTKKVFRVYKGGVRLSHPPDKWVPANDPEKGVELTSTLVIKEGTNWLPAPDHACRIHFFELLKVSQEKGICMNAPLPEKALQCRDLKIRQEAGQEAFLDTSVLKDCNGKEYFMQARTENPARSYSIKIYSEDYGSYGFLRSYANINLGGQAGIKKTNPVYTSVPVLRTEVEHPYKTEKQPPRVKKTVYTDNRVTLPLDIDENKIPDYGWSFRGGSVDDFTEEIKSDWDNDPPGDGWQGDGLTHYEEYRGFMVAGSPPKHRRTNPIQKDLFVDNKDNLPISEFIRITRLAVHEISEDQYGSIENTEFERYKNIKMNYRFINFNSGVDHVTAQKGLRLRNVGIPDPVEGEYILGLTPSDKDLIQKKVYPAPPNWNLEVRVDKAKIERLYMEAAGLVKLKQIVAHELCHAVNVAHHGEKEDDPGLFSGDVNCIMRYEPRNQNPGTLLCAAQNGAGKGRGSCINQLRVSGRKDPVIMIGYPKKD